MARKHSSRKHSSKKTHSTAVPAVAWLLAATIWIIPAGACYFLYKFLNDELPGLAGYGNINSTPGQFTSLPKNYGGPVELEVASSLILNPESAELYNRIANRQQTAEQQEEREPQPEPALEILGPRWLLTQPGDAFIIQYLTSANMDELVDFSERFSGDVPVTIYPYKQRGETVEYGLARGIFESLNSAQLVLNDHPEQLLVHKPWIRPVRQVSRQISAFIAR